jgi:hypothetical protein
VALESAEAALSMPMARLPKAPLPGELQPAPTDASAGGRRAQS